MFACLVLAYAEDWECTVYFPLDTAYLILKSIYIHQIIHNSLDVSLQLEIEI